MPFVEAPKDAVQQRGADGELGRFQPGDGEEFGQASLYDAQRREAQYKPRIRIRIGMFRVDTLLNRDRVVENVLGFVLSIG